LRSILEIVRDEPVLLSLHSAGCAKQLLEIVADRPHPGVVLHWFLGNEADLDNAVSLGCYFSVNAAMPDKILLNIPMDRMLPETDFPTTKRRGGGSLPGDTASIERRIANMRGCTLDALRRRWYRNLRALAVASGALDRLPDELADYAIRA
jgi:TatD DNase family protein